MLRALDKLDKIGWDRVKVEMNKLNLKKGQIDDIKEFIRRQDFDDRELKTLKLFLLPAAGIPKNSYEFDFSVARGLGYYTGIVFETVLTKFPEIGSVFSGGRYDSLVSKFSSQLVKAVGASVGVDRLFTAIEKLGKRKKSTTKVRVCVLNFEGGSDVKEQRMRAAMDLRRAKIPTNLCFDNQGSLKDQLAYASAQKYPIAVIIGSDEAGKQPPVAQVKDMAKRTQTEVKQTDIVSAVKKLLS